MGRGHLFLSRQNQCNSSIIVLDVSLKSVLFCFVGRQTLSTDAFN